MFETPFGATPLEEDEIAGLIPGYLSTRADLNQVEAENIARARLVFRRHPSRYGVPDVLLTEETVRRVHKEMFADVWKWAGEYRIRETNIGIDPLQIRLRLPNLLLNVREQLLHCDIADRESCDEVIVRFHWDLVRIHPFPNGNGRHARMMADLLVTSLGHPAYSWGPRDLVDPDYVRREYIDGLIRADDTRGDVTDLVAFARREQA